MGQRSALLALVALVSGCGPPPTPAPASHAPPSTHRAHAATATTGAAGDDREAMVRAHAARARRPIGAVKPHPLPFAILPVAGGQSVLLVAQDTAQRITFVRRIGSDHALGPVVALAGQFVVGGFEAAEPRLVSSDGEQICIAPFHGGASAEACRTFRPTLLVPLGSGLALIEQRLVPEPDTAVPHQPAAKHGAGTDPPKRAPSTRKRSGGKKKKKKEVPQKISVWLHRVDRQGRFEPAPLETGLEFARPMPGMELVDAAPTRQGVRLLWYEHAPTRKQAGRSVRRAALRTGRLDPDGRYLRPTRSKLFEGERSYGFIDGHQQPRLFSRAERVVYLGRFVKTKGRERTTGFEAIQLRPRRNVDVPAAVAGVDPFLLTGPAPMTDAELEFAAATWERSPSLCDGQPRWQAEHVAWTAGRGYFQVGGELHWVGRADGMVRTQAHPFVAERSRVYWAAFSPTGAGLARTNEGYALLSAEGSLSSVAPPPNDRGGAAQAVAHQDVALPRAVRIGAAWWALRPVPGEGAQHAGYAVARLLPAAGMAQGLPATVVPDAAVLVGGESHGLLVTRRGAGRRECSLLLWKLDESGRASRLPAALPPVLAGFDAVERAAGGAIIAGESPLHPGRIEILTVDQTGRRIGHTQSSLTLDAERTRPRLRALPGGGALLTTQARKRVAWLDDDGAEVAAKDWPTATSGARCADGHAARQWVPTPRPGELARPVALAAPGSCQSGDEQWAADGSLRWFGSTVTGLHSRAEVGVIPPAAAVSSPQRAPGAASATAAAADTAGAKPTAPGRASVAPCPPDMVSVRGQLCVDRFEVRLTDGRTGLPLSPDYPATPNLAEITHGRWIVGRWQSGDLHAKAMPLPPLLRPRDAEPAPVARNLRDVRPSGYLTGIVATKACRAAGKRLCRPEEFAMACRGQDNRKFPYGSGYEPRACNVYRYEHPAARLHGNPSVGHLDPRLNRVTVQGKPLLHLTGANPRCRSQWGDDFIYDMVGNLDEWVDEPKGAFAGGFYARTTRAGCDAIITAHPRRYLDYSIGTRCCLDPYVWPGAQR